MLLDESISGILNCGGRVSCVTKYSGKKPMSGRILTIPNLLSFFRISLIPVFAWSYCVKRDNTLTAIFLLLSGATDIIDGFIARTFHMVSDLGKVLDPVADKLTQATMLICLMTRFPLMTIPLAVMAVKELYMAISGYIVIRKTGVVPCADWHGKVATVLLYGMMILHVFWPELPSVVSNLTIGISTAMIVVSFIFYAIRNSKALKGKR